MDSQSMLIILPFLTAFSVLLMRTHYEALWKKIQRPFLISLSVGSAVTACLMLLSVCLILGKPRFSPVEKAVYCLGAALVIGLLLWINLAGWKKWRDEQGKQ